MLMSPERKFVFVEVPKTGTSAIARRLLEIDPTLERDILHLPNGRRMHLDSTHTSAIELRQLLGAAAADYTFVGFLRDPIDLIASKYYYYKVGRVRDDIRGDRYTSGRLIRNWSTWILPLHLWILFYPYRSSASFVTDKAGDLCLDIVGNFGSLEKNFRDIFIQFGYNSEDLILERVNTSKYNPPSGHIYRFLVGLSLFLHARNDERIFKETLNGGDIFHSNSDRD